MRQAAIATLLAVMLLTWPAQAQTERVLIDATLQPALPHAGGTCMQIEPGTLAVRERLVETNSPAQRIFRLGNRNGSDGGSLIAEALDQQEHVVTVGLTEPQGIYCWSIHVDMATDEQRDEPAIQLVAVKMTLSQ